jgi:hypothetical protein
MLCVELGSADEKAVSLLAALEVRMRQAETFAWAVPALALTAQALLLTVVFNDSTTTAGRVLASLTGLVILLAALHLLGKHTFNFDMYEAAIERERNNLKLPGVSRKQLLADVGSFPAESGFRERDWMALEHSPNRLRRTWVNVRKRLVVDRKAVVVWAVALALLALIDLGVFVYSLIDAAVDGGSSKGSPAPIAPPSSGSDLTPDPWKFGWDALVAIGTLTLAAVTAILAGVTTAMARKTGQLAAATERELDIATEDLAVARAAVAGQVRPVLIGVPPGRFSGPTETVEVPGLGPGRAAAHITDPATIVYEYHDGTLFISVPFRNEGAGIAFIARALLIARDGDHEWLGLFSTPAVPSHEFVRISFGLGPEEADLVPTREQGRFTVVAHYSDLAGAIWASRLEFQPGAGGWQAGGVIITAEGQTSEAGGGAVEPSH